MTTDQNFHSRLALLISAVIVSLSITLIWNARESSRDLAEAAVSNVAEIESKRIQQIFNGIDTFLKVQAHRFKDHSDKGPAELTPLYRELADELPFYKGLLRVGVTNAQGLQVFNSGAEPDGMALVPHVRDRDYFQKAKGGERGLIYAGPLQARIDKQWVVVLARAIESSTDEFEGVVFGLMPVSALSASFENLDLGEGGIANLRTLDFAQVARYPALEGVNQGPGNRNVSQTFRDLFKNFPDRDRHIYRTVAPIDGTERVYAVQKLDGSPFWMTVGKSTKAFEAGWIQLTTGLLLVIGPLILIMMVWARRLDRQHAALTQMVEAKSDALQLSEERYQTLFDFSPDGYLIASTENGVILDCNQILEQLFGAPRDQIVGKTTFDFSPEWQPNGRSSLDYGTEIIGKCLVERKAFFEWRHTRLDGSTFEAEVALIVSYYKGEEAFVCTLRDVSKRKEIEARLIESEEALRLAQAVAKTGSWWYDGQSEQFGVSEETARLFDLGTSGFTTFEEWFSRVHPADQAFVEKSWLAHLDGAPYDITYRIVVRNRVRWMHALATIETQAGGQLLRAVGTVQDVTESKRSRDELLQAKEEAVKANLAKSAFLATMSHEIRTPLNAVIGTSYLMGLKALTADQKKDLEIISTSSRNLLALVNDVLDFSKIEAGELEIESRPFSLAETLQDIHVQFAGAAAQKGLRFEPFDLPKDVAAAIVGDSNRLKQILINLLNNAIKFTPTGQVALTVRKIGPPGADRQRLQFTVSDTGIGISTEAQGRLFEPFKQVDSSTSREYGGTGLGLSIVKRLVELMGGEIRLRSNPGKGSEFEFELPFGVHDQPLSSRQMLKQTPQRALNVVVVEDEPVDRGLLVQVCTGFGWQVESTDNGRDMIAIVEAQLAQGRRIDCILLDWHMPGQDGLESLAQLKVRIGDRHLPSVIMVTAHDRNDLERAIGAVRPDSILKKPIEPASLFNSVNEAVIAQGSGLSEVINSTLVQNRSIQWLSGARVMVVDDNQLNLEVIGSILESEGCEVFACQSGASALSVLEEQAQKGLQIDAVLMDMQMPVMDGCETTMQIRGRPQFETLPVIALTAGATTTERDRALASGMSDFLTKPAEPLTLMRVLRAQIEMHRGSALPLTAAAPRPANADLPLAAALKNPELDVSSTSQGWPEVKGIDSAYAQKVMSGDAAFFKTMLIRFKLHHTDTADRLRALMESGEFAKAASLAHTLKGIAGNLGANDIFAAADAVEASAQNQSKNAHAELETLQAALTVVLEQELN